jgi:hypothetical protein
MTKKKIKETRAWIYEVGWNDQKNKAKIERIKTFGKDPGGNYWFTYKQIKQELIHLRKQ